MAFKVLHTPASGNFLSCVMLLSFAKALVQAYSYAIEMTVPQAFFALDRNFGPCKHWIGALLFKCLCPIFG
jgi:hypothetical protein